MIIFWKRYRWVFLFLFFGVVLLSCEEDKPEPIVDEPEVEDPVQDVFTNGTVSKIIDNGDTDKRINMIFIGDGYAEKDMVRWRGHVEHMTSSIFASELGEPFGRYHKFFNVFRIDMISEHSGLDADNRTTPLRGMTSCNNWQEGDCITDWERTHDAIDFYMAQFDNPHITYREIALNSNQHFGSVHYPARGLLNTYSAGNKNVVNIFLHENGHMGGRLADEYVNDANETYTGNEPSNVNITKTLNPLKWDIWVGYDQPYALTDNTVIGTFEGAKYVGKGIYRPAEQCMMNGYVNPFCAICREKIIHEFYKEVRPIDTLIVEMPLAKLELVDPDLFHIRWYINDEILQDTLSALDLSNIELPAGEHTLKVVVSDMILDYSETGSYYDWVRRDTMLLTQEIERVIELRENN